LLLIFAAQRVSAQFMPAAGFFDSGAQFYISNNIPAAKERVESGLKFYPDDAKLKKLEELLKQQQQSQNSQSQQNQQQKQQSQQQKKDQPSQQQKSGDQKNSQDAQKQDSQNQSGQKKDEPQKQQERQKAAAQKKDGEKPEDQQGEGRPAGLGQMTPEEAKRLLDAQKGDEQILQLKPKVKPEQDQSPVKDW
jgi:Ca-activated chloride channel family protein